MPVDVPPAFSISRPSFRPPIRRSSTFAQTRDFSSVLPEPPISKLLYDTGAGSLSVILSAFENNQAPGGSGGGIYFSGNALTISSSVFSSNTSTSNGGAFDGGATGASFCITQSAFIGNTASTGGGVIMPQPGSPALGKGRLTTFTSAPVSGVDQNGNPRSSGGVCNVGAYE